MIEFDKVTTRGGDWGEASLANGERRRKDDLLFEMMGTLDELSSFLGVARAEARRGPREESWAEELAGMLAQVQQTLLSIGAQVATPPSDPASGRLRTAGEREVEALEEIEERYLREAEIGDRFILPGESPLSAQLDVARAVCRRAERCIVACIRERSLAALAPSQRYLNRLSDLLFVVARFVDTKRGRPEQPSGGSGRPA